MYYDENMSLAAIAKELDTYPKKIERLLKKNNCTLRSNSESQKVAMQEGRLVHKKGFSLSEDHKIRISEGMEEKWAGKSQQEIKDFSNTMRKRWNERSEEDRQSFREASREALRKASVEGSRLEKSLTEALVEAGYVPLTHQSHTIDEAAMHLDILLEDEGIAIEIDGPFHREVIWDEKSLNRVKKSDAKKNAKLNANGYHVIRVVQKKTLNKLMEKRLIGNTLLLIEELKDVIVPGVHKVYDKKY